MEFKIKLQLLIKSELILSKGKREKLLKIQYIKIKNSFDGTPGRIRTCDLRIRSPTLYPAELRAHLKLNISKKIKLFN